MSIKNESNGLKLFLVEQNVDDIPEDDQLEVLFYATKKGWGYGQSNEFSFVRRVKMSKKTTTKKLHFEIFKYYRFLLNRNWPKKDRKKFM